MKPQSKIGFCLLLACFAASLSVFNVHAFSLLGPVQPWMQASNGVVWPGDIGGPMEITNEYRWNVPVVTYGFDQSFLDYFGTNGIAAVENAIEILNDLPPASQIVLTNYPFSSQTVNEAAKAQWLVDLKSETLAILLEHLGLTQPTRYIYVLYDWDPSFFAVPPYDIDISIIGMPIFFERDDSGLDPGASGCDPIYPICTPGYVTNLIAGFNFDPETLQPSALINNILYGGYFDYYDGQTYIQPFSVDPLADTYTAVADFDLMPGGFYTGLTYDDIGGLAYLLSTNNVNFETLMSGVFGVGTNADSYVNGVWRPGVDKITFIHVALDPLTGEMFLPLTNYYTDIYITNGASMQQQVARVISRPDFLFSVADLGKNDITTPWFERTGTTNWINNAALNGNPGGAGPGVIQPPVQIVFNTLGRQMFSYVGLNGITDETSEDDSMPWGTFDGSTNAPIIYPVSQTGSPQMTVRMWLTRGSSKNNLYINPFQRSFEWSATSPAGTPFAFQTTSNLMDWVTLFSVTNNGSISYYFVNNPASTSRFYRLIPQ